VTAVVPTTNIGRYEADIKEALSKASDAAIVSRIWKKDFTVWKPDPTEITNRLGWLDVAETMSAKMPMLSSLAPEMSCASFRHVVLLGMGGSSLGAAVLGYIFGRHDSYPRLIVLDSTLPETIQMTVDSIDPKFTLFIVSSKSGTTTEPLILYAFFRDWLDKELGREEAGRHFIAITDAGTPLVELAEQDSFRHISLNPSDIGGRYSVLSYFGLVPASLIGVDISTLLQRACAMRGDCSDSRSDYENPGVWLGTCMGALALTGRDKLTLITSPSVAAFGLWVEQLIAESTGKEGKGIIPISYEPPMEPEYYGDDRLFIYMRVAGDKNHATDAVVSRLISSAQPTVVLQLKDIYDVGAEFFRWEFATAVAGAVLGIQPFDQPDVQKSKDVTAHLLEELSASGHLPESEGAGSLRELLSHAASGRYLAVMAYLNQTGETDKALGKLRRKVAETHRIATTLGYGPRFLHSTGQLYKGGKNTGLFLQLTIDHDKDLSVPGKPYSFGTVADAQALGDFRALQTAGRMVVRINLHKSGASDIEGLL
jgi:transaldolase/glucose-6-phosphate isomerase